MRTAQWQRFGLNFVLVATMVLGPFPLMAPAVVAVDLIASLGMTTGTFGVAITANTVAAAAFAPLSGRITDRIGPKASVVLTIATSGIGLLGMAFAPDVWTLMASATFAGLGQGWCNPATNKLIAERVPDGRRGTVTGLKQSGVMFGSFLAGATLPTLAAWFGWRVAVAVYGVVAVVCALGIQAWLRPDESPVPEAGSGGRWRASGALAAREKKLASSRVRRPPQSVFESAHRDETWMSAGERRFIYTLAWYSLFMGSVVGGVSRFQPLFAEETLGWTNFWAGMAAALVGITAVGSRIWWARLTERRVRPPSALALQAALTVAAMAMLAGAGWGAAWLLWAMAVLAGFSMASWNAVAMLSIITGVPVALAGRASGIVMAGFMSGLSLGGLATGYIVDWTGSFDLAWLLFGLFAAVSTGLAFKMRTHRRT